MTSLILRWLASLAGRGAGAREEALRRALARSAGASRRPDDSARGRKFNWAAEAMAARLLAERDPGAWYTVGTHVARVHAFQINRGRKPAFRPAGSYKAVTRGGGGNYATLLVQYLGPRVAGDCEESLTRLIGNYVGCAQCGAPEEDIEPEDNGVGECCNNCGTIRDHEPIARATFNRAGERVPP